MAYSSRLLDALDDIVTELSTISTANGFYYNPTIVRAIRPADKVVEPPEIGVELGNEIITSEVINDNVFRSEATVTICGTVQSEHPLDADGSEIMTDTEKLRHDIKRIIAGMFFKYHQASPTWHVKRDTVRLFPLVGLDDNRTKAQVWAQFTIRIVNLDTTLA